MARKGDGQPRSNKRIATNQISKRVTDDVLARFIERADSAGFDDYRDYLGAFVLGEIELDRAVKKDIVRTLGALGKIGSNLNQIAHAFNAGRQSSLMLDDFAVLTAVLNAVRNSSAAIRRALKP